MKMIPAALCKNNGLWLFIVVLGALSMECFVTNASAAEVDRSPVDVALAVDGSWLVTVNQTSNTASLVRTSDGKVLDEVPVGKHPAMAVALPSGKQVLVSGSYSGELTLFDVADEKLKTAATIRLLGEPHGMAVSADGKTVYVALTAVDQVVIVDLVERKETARIDVGRWPRYLALSPDGKRLEVGTSGDRGISLVDLETKKLVSVERFIGLNIGHMQVATDGQVYFPWIVYRRNPINAGNIRLGWVLASRLGRQPFDSATRREAISLDPPGRAVADPHGLALTRDQERIVVSASGSQELLIYKRAGLPFLDRGGPDHIDPKLLADKEPDCSVSPDEAVAHGAALQAGITLARNAGAAPRFRVQNVNSHSLGVVATDTKTKRARNAILVPRNTPLPVTAKRVFKTQKRGQRSILVQIVEGESASPDDCSQIGKCTVRDLPVDLPAQTPIEVRFKYEENGRLTVQVQVANTDTFVQHEITRENSITRDALDSWRQYISGLPAALPDSTVGRERAADPRATVLLDMDPQAPLVAPDVDGGSTKGKRWA